MPNKGKKRGKKKETFSQDKVSLIQKMGIPDGLEFSEADISLFISEVRNKTRHAPRCSIFLILALLQQLKTNKDELSQWFSECFEDLLYKPGMTADQALKIVRRVGRPLGRLDEYIDPYICYKHLREKDKQAKIDEKVSNEEALAIVEKIFANSKFSTWLKEKTKEGRSETFRVVFNDPDKVKRIETSIEVKKSTIVTLPDGSEMIWWSENDVLKRYGLLGK